MSLMYIISILTLALMHAINLSEADFQDSCDKKFVERCTNCKIASTCPGSSGTVPTVSQTRCDESCLKNATCKMVQFDPVTNTCYKFNCQMVEQATGYHTAMLSCYEGSCDKITIERCENCKAAQACPGSPGSLGTVPIVTRTMCDESCLTSGTCKAVQFDPTINLCLTFDCEMVEEATAYYTAMLSCYEDCPEYTLTTLHGYFGCGNMHNNGRTSSFQYCFYVCLHFVDKYSQRCHSLTYDYHGWCYLHVYGCRTARLKHPDNIFMYKDCSDPMTRLQWETPKTVLAATTSTTITTSKLENTALESFLNTTSTQPWNSKPMGQATKTTAMITTSLGKTTTQFLKCSTSALAMKWSILIQTTSFICVFFVFAMLYKYHTTLVYKIISFTKYPALLRKANPDVQV